MLRVRLPDDGGGRRGRARPRVWAPSRGRWRGACPKARSASARRVASAGAARGRASTGGETIAARCGRRRDRGPRGRAPRRPAAAPGSRPVTCLYFAAERRPDRPSRSSSSTGTATGPVNNLCVPTQAAPGYGPAGATLVSASVVGGAAGDADEAALERRRARADARAGSAARSRGWRHLRTVPHPPRPAGAAAGAARADRAGGPARRAASSCAATTATRRRSTARCSPAVAPRPRSAAWTSGRPAPSNGRCRRPVRPCRARRSGTSRRARPP